ncbi:capsular biosynthesis protein [Komagataeibacter intermedius]|uniref:Capsular biosynthesis protein n=2 Tax=Komagataeibacter intermedius TaxID=66229 RepID=A0A0N1FNN6_9PROT|nr:capsular biosynthesis protein [Komagataeibacter intermedius]KPH88802.1 hypothetical protein GLUCOINTEAF2_0201345 [Komagataeibacter intermedius AF2]MCF3635282.1 capsular biosynthesis protein [Komagataeibacter intermedius]GAN87839.1 hypothetical protein Gain_0099_007 [Komagataeibacter intermedius TF2]GBQ67783.1 dTDP-glucose pyrophosphorylase [Komagataeibacter intermedius NRIC 0521]
MIIFPMVGMSRRFREAGYDRPKYMLPLGNHTCFDYSVMGFLKAGRQDTFTFIMRKEFDTPDFVRQRLAALGVTNARLVILDEMTAGQAETVERGLDGVTDAGPTGMTIFNIDTFRPGFTFPPKAAQGDGYLETFVGEGDNWSFVESDGSDQNRVIRTTEKEPISHFCCTGLYQFATISDFRWALDEERKNPSKNELYVAPIYNHLIKIGKDIRYTVIPKENVIFCGVPAEYEALTKDGGKEFEEKFLYLNK